jgi:predicted nucleic acid-binding Zn ribbon protein
MNIRYTNTSKCDMMDLRSTIINKGVFMQVFKKCVVCGKDFSVPVWREKTARACSDKCAIVARAKSRERQVESTCKVCGKVFSSCKSKGGKRVYCSYPCRSIGRHDEQSNRIMGDKNPLWKGGEMLHTRGYILKIAKYHPFSVNSHVFKHRLVAEQHLRDKQPDSVFLVKIGEMLYLSNDISVHHLDWDKTNNKKSNLLVCTKGAHAQIHNGVHPEPGTYWPNDAKIKLGRNLDKE